MTKWYHSLGITDTQFPYYRLWFYAIVLTEGLMLIGSKYLFFIYLAIAAAFLAGFLLRLLRIYPGQPEPLIPDFSAVCLAVGMAFLGQWLVDSPWRFLLIFCSSIIVVPHFAFIAKEK